MSEYEDQQDDSPPVKDFAELMELSDKLADKIGDTLDGQPMLVAVTALMQVVRGGLETSAEQVALILAASMANICLLYTSPRPRDS